MWYTGATTMRHFAVYIGAHGCSGAFCLRAAAPRPREAEIESPVPVIAEPVRLGNIRTTISATGVVTTLAGAEFSVVAPQPARIAEITKNVGDAVKSGEVIVRFEFPSLRAQTAVNAAAVKAADLRLQQAKLAQTRIRSLLSRGAASQREMDDADREATLAEGELAVANSGNERCRSGRTEHGRCARRSTAPSPSAFTTLAISSGRIRMIRSFV